ncbi:MAG: hypothetical protein JSV96_15540 [Candidatus Aminicenantes bacterium]|nr:MAG: hypothetical protein JSV96_15540 [Candidatus Aminicenantes bacterium]
MFESRRIGIKGRMVHAWGKIRRLYYVYIRPGYVAKKKKLKKGECLRCAACCKLLLTCPYLTMTNGIADCKIHDRKFKACKFYPIDEADLRDRDIVSPEKKCGFYFIEEE